MPAAAAVVAKVLRYSKALNQIFLNKYALFYRGLLLLYRYYVYSLTNCGGGGGGNGPYLFSK
jgi:hypothetical protein